MKRQDELIMRTKMRSLEDQFEVHLFIQNVDA